jgi:hypothetical protein
MPDNNQTSGGFVAPTQNPVLEALSASTAAIANAAKPLVDVYSTFLNAKTAAKLAKMQAAGGGVSDIPDQSILNPINQAETDATAKTYFVYAVLGLAVAAGAVMVFKAARKK